MSSPPPETPPLSVVVPTRNRAAYLHDALASLASQQAPVEVVVVDDGSADGTAEVIRAAGVRGIRFDRPRGLNAARNAGLAATRAPLVAFVDDDVRIPPGWSHAIVTGAGAHRDADAFGGPIVPVLEGPDAPRGCGREPIPITHLDLGPLDREAPMVWGANLVVRRSATVRVGTFDESIAIYGDEEDWLLRLVQAGGRIVYLADAGLEHRRRGRDARTPALSRAAYRRGVAARRGDERRGIQPPLGGELRVVVGCAAHVVRFRCPFGIVMGAEALGRLAHALGLG